ncbi:hypothetical protein AIOL_002208 [Candidatus Rhodobacter oscarellae]|uniref:Major capsid protein n=1 Tax=Candidatus Rhodobacter oscarellae TaxID=1675527 RepID=A0A0J9E3H3_9RHOB|nr:hypothetical protein [Candidatus Rhodobacter lobularis]KMW57247.1 hypothetical protein AIOL_002208 [Candidatus Rhodobacter lobularis]
MYNRNQQRRNTRRESVTKAGRFRGGKLAPVMCVPLRESEGGYLQQTMFYELDPIAGRLVSPITAELISVFVPVQAIDALKDPSVDLPGNTEFLRHKMLLGQTPFALEPENDISKRLGVEPRQTGLGPVVNEVARLGYNCAVNYLRRRKYHKAAQLGVLSNEVVPSLYSRTVLERLNGVLDPEDRVDGAVDLSGKIPITGLGVVKGPGGDEAKIKETGGSLPGVTYAKKWDSDFSEFLLQEDPDNPGFPGLFADLARAAQSLSLRDFYRAEEMDKLTREMRDLVDKFPEYGGELVARFAAGFNVDVGAQPFVIYENEVTFGQNLQRATDGPNLGKLQSSLTQTIDFAVPIPKTEMGGVIITMASVKPDEALARMPHPILTRGWKARNHVADEIQIDPQPLYAADVDSSVDSANRKDVVCYTGINEIERNYVNYGFSRKTDLTTVAAKTAIWRVDVPISVTPETVSYPADIHHYPFADRLAEVCQYTIASQAIIETPRVFGPRPVEELEQIETADVFGDAV